ncbi:hypothetical protein AM499_05115 [Bacillus sp. FJAT-22090]|uniref:hypothetical protein n=1 Tax=Bacillus sp. FJAT-22090 TaxID=1581038 RepID=UPI0006B028FB|nr:hypothetical protein [Bacillus sp. FJAT-22090]ALC85264.1 hypothetical protein AM499_05115 [Bacillus sp. FJAT-22090]
MGKYLKEFNFDEKIKTYFTEENKQRVLEKINEIEKKRNKKPYYFQNALTLAFTIGLIILGFTLISNNLEGTKENAGELNKTENEFIQNQNNDESNEVLGTVDDDEEKKKEKLKVGAHLELRSPETNLTWNKETKEYEKYDYTDSNYNLYVAHLRAALITDNALYTRYPSMDYTTYQKYLGSILFYLNEIEPDEEKIEELKMAIKLSEQAIETNAQKGDPILDELHLILHELDEYFNLYPFVDHITNEDGLQFKSE